MSGFWKAKNLKIGIGGNQGRHLTKTNTARARVGSAGLRRPIDRKKIVDEKTHAARRFLQPDAIRRRGIFHIWQGIGALRQQLKPWRPAQIAQMEGAFFRPTPAEIGNLQS